MDRRLFVALSPGPAVRAGLARAVSAAAAPGPVSWPAHRLVLFESHLGAGGVRHQPLLEAPLGAAPLEG